MFENNEIQARNQVSLELFIFYSWWKSQLSGPAKVTG